MQPSNLARKKLGYKVISQILIGPKFFIVSIFLTRVMKKWRFRIDSVFLIFMCLILWFFSILYLSVAVPSPVPYLEDRYRTDGSGYVSQKLVKKTARELAENR